MADVIPVVPASQRDESMQNKETGKSHPSPKNGLKWSTWPTRRLQTDANYYSDVLPREKLRADRKLTEARRFGRNGWRNRADDRATKDGNTNADEGMNSAAITGADEGTTGSARTSATGAGHATMPDGGYPIAIGGVARG